MVALLLSAFAVMGSQADALNLIACPDCEKMVSRRAVHCPHCGCPAKAIAAAVLKADLEAKKKAESKIPRPVVALVADGKAGHGIAYRNGDDAFLLLTAPTLATASSMEIRRLGDSGLLSYSDLEVADSAPLVRFRLTGENVELLDLTQGKGTGPITGFLNSAGKKTPGTSPLTSPPAAALAGLTTTGKLAALALADGKTSRWVTVTHATTWKKVPPSLYRSQARLLQDILTRVASGKVPGDATKKLRATDWASDYLQQQAQHLLKQINP